MTTATATAILTLRLDDTTGQSELVLDDQEVIDFLLSQPNPQAALRESLRRGMQSLRLVHQPWPEEDVHSYRNMGAAL